LAPHLAGRDLRISSRTGSGKTVALGLVVGQQLIASAPPPAATASLCAHPRVLLIAPTRELAAQIGRELEWLYAGLKVGICVVTGGTSVGGERRDLARGPAVVVGTPGRLVDHLQRGALALAQTECVVLDEADQMLELGFREPLELLLGELSTECRRHLVSATFARGVLALASRYQRDAVMVTGGEPAQSGHEDITHLAYLMHPRERYAALVNVLLVAPEERTLVFVRTRADASEVATRLIDDGFRAGALSGEMAQAERTRTLEAFRRGSLSILVCTDVASRGIDVPEISRVIHAELPSAPEVLTHRSGRTGRAGRKGTSIMLVGANERGAAEMLLVRARIHAQLLAVPSAEEVRAAADERLFEELTVEGEESQSALVAKLIETLGAERAIERLLARARKSGPVEPSDLTPVSLQPRPFERNNARPMQRRAGPPRRVRHG
jgi:ATP-dependent RNA helicase DeaD